MQKSNTKLFAYYISGVENMETCVICAQSPEEKIPKLLKAEAADVGTSIAVIGNIAVYELKLIRLTFL